MKKSAIFKVICLVLTVALLLAAAVSAGAAHYVGDLNGDGRISAFDAQVLAEAGAGNRELSDVQRTIAEKLSLDSILAYLFGDTAIDAGDLDADGVTEIYSAAGLQLMAQNPDGYYILADNIDLQGAEWMPISGFSGTFDGNGYTISNLTVSNAQSANLGFFGDTTAEAVINGLALRNVTVNAGGSNQYIGMAVGTSRGTLTDVTVTGAIYDTRTALPGGTTPANINIYTGVLVGRTVLNSGTHTGGTSITVTDDTGTHSVSGLCADVKLYIEKDSQTVFHNGLWGYRYDGTSVTGQWRDSTNNASNVSATMRDRQDRVVDYMNAMAQVAWTVPETMQYVAAGVTTQTFEPGITYYGLPYNGRNGSLERFLYCMDQVDGVNVATTRYGTVCEKANPDGWMLYMGNDCSSAVCQAWAQVSPSRVGSYKLVDGQVVEQGSTEYAGGVYVRTTGYMYPSLTTITTNLKNEAGEYVKAQLTYQQYHGIYPVGEWTTVGQQGTENADSIVGTFAYDCDNVVNSAEVLNYNTEQQMGEAYAITHKADAIVGGNPQGHARLVVAYPVTIRNADGTIDMDKSFLVCTEQGDGLYDGLSSSWRVNYRWSYNNLLAKDTDNKLDEEDGNAASVGKVYSRCVYLPITMRALRADYVKYSYVDESVQVTGPATGRTYSNYRTVSSTVIVKDGDGRELFRHTTFAGLETGNTYSDHYRGQGQLVDLDYAHGEAYRAFAEENLIPGQTYYYSVQLLLSNGDTRIISRDGLHWQANGHSGGEFDPFVYSN